MHLARALAAAQTTPVPGDVEGNVTQHLALAALAVSQGAKTVLFPELSLTGYELGRVLELAFSRGDPRLEPIRTFAEAEGVTLIVGAPLQLDSGLHIAALIVLPSGDVDVYTKHHLGAFSDSERSDGPVPPPERSVFVPGTENPVLRCGHGRAGIAICADMSRPAHALGAAERGSSTYLASAFVIPPDYPADAARLRYHAARHRMTVVLANYGGPTGGLSSAGRSAIWSETGALLVDLRESGAGVAIAVEAEGGWRTRASMLH
ncbi:MAG: carbon-nitrogen hydrolase family protein [Gemmatimonadetes bacterium]|nr:carbon-nitrogen hydrolase family protein [Gemmatimonadota bacterium]